MVLQPMHYLDVDAVLGIQEPGAIAALAEIFPQDEYPFPRAELRRRWLAEISDSDVQCFVIRPGEYIAGFAALRGTELLHFGTVMSTWGSGLASAAHDELLAILRRQGETMAWLRVFEANARARRFYVKHRWLTDGERSTSSFPPHPVLLRYERSL
jgi:RimJ/RimL family protein N-acetyltransferase